MSSVLCLSKVDTECIHLNAFPDELLSKLFCLCIPSLFGEEHAVEVFATAISDELSDPNFVRTQLMRVCKLWRNVIEATPEAWQSISIFSAQSLDVNNVKRWFMRSKACIKDVALYKARDEPEVNTPPATSTPSWFANRSTDNIKDIEYLRTLKDVVALIIQHAVNIRSLYLSSSNLDYRHVILPLLKCNHPINMPNLQCFITDFRTSNRFVMLSPQDHPVSIHAPRLERLVMDPFTTPFLLQTFTPTSLDTLHHAKIAATNPTATHYLKVLAQNGSPLTSLGWTCEGNLEGDDTHLFTNNIPANNLHHGPTELKFPNLTSFSLIISPGGTPQLSSFLDFKAPVLSTCQISSWDKTPFSALTPLFQGLPNIRDLSLSGLRTNGSDVQQGTTIAALHDLFGGLKHLRRLNLERCTFGKEIFGVVKEESRWIEEIYVRQMMISAEDLLGLVEGCGGNIAHSSSFSSETTTSDGRSRLRVTLEDYDIHGTDGVFLRIKKILGEDLRLERLQSEESSMHKVRYSEQIGRPKEYDNRRASNLFSVWEEDIPDCLF